MTEPRVHKIWECPICGWYTNHAGVQCSGNVNPYHEGAELPYHELAEVQPVEYVPKADYDKLKSKFQAAMPLTEYATTSSQLALQRFFRDIDEGHYD